MGNHFSCIPRITGARTAKLVDAEGNLRRVKLPAGAADLMLEAPGHVVARAEEMVTTRCMSGLRADEELRAGEVYLLLSVDRVGSRISDRQVDVILVLLGAIEGGRRRRRTRTKGRNECASAGSQVFSDTAGKEEEEKGGEENGLFTEGKVTGFSGQHLGGLRWRPALDTSP